MKVCSSLFVAFLLYFHQPVTAQDHDTSDLLLYTSPSVHLNDIMIQTHKGLPRFGELNLYTTEQRGAAQQNLREKQQRILKDFATYKKLISLKYAETYLKDMDTEKRTQLSRNDLGQKDKNSKTAQDALRNIVSPDFCRSDVCVNAFGGNNEFEQVRNYKAFATSVVPDLQKWSKTFFGNNTETVYHVARLTPRNSYDFEKKGYWVTLSHNLFKSRQRSPILQSVFKPKVAYEVSLFKKFGPNQALSFFLPINEATAEDIQKNRTTLYLVRKLQFSISPETRENLDILSFSYHHASPSMEIYKDAALSEKIGSLSMDNLTLKE